MYQSDYRPHFPPPWIRSEYPSVRVPSLGAAGIASPLVKMVCMAAGRRRESALPASVRRAAAVALKD